MTTYCLDTSAWLEYLNDGPNGPHIKDLVDHRTVVTPAVVAAELVEAAQRRKLNTQAFLEFLEGRSVIVPIDASIARAAGRLNAQYATEGSSWGMTESLVLATARAQAARLVTRDPIYRDMPNIDPLGSD